MRMGGGSEIVADFQADKEGLEIVEVACALVFGPSGELWQDGQRGPPAGRRVVERRAGEDGVFAHLVQVHFLEGGCADGLEAREPAGGEAVAQAGAGLEFEFALPFSAGDLLFALELGAEVDRPDECVVEEVALEERTGRACSRRAT